MRLGDRLGWPKVTPRPYAAYLAQLRFRTLPLGPSPHFELGGAVMFIFRVAVALVIIGNVACNGGTGLAAAERGGTVRQCAGPTTNRAACAARELVDLVEAKDEQMEQLSREIACLRACLLMAHPCACDERGLVVGHRRLHAQNESADEIGVPRATAVVRETDPLAPWREDLPQLREQFLRDGFVVVQGLIDDAAVAAANSAAVSPHSRSQSLTGSSLDSPFAGTCLTSDLVAVQWEMMGKAGIRQDDRSTWPTAGADLFESKLMSHPKIAALWTPAYRAMAKALYPDEGAEPIPLNWYHHATNSSSEPDSMLGMHVFPGTQEEGPNSLPWPHIDHSGPRMTPEWSWDCLRDHGWHTCCLPMRLSTMHYLTPTAEGGGGTFVSDTANFD